jgi:hypothetical protein
MYSSRRGAVSHKNGRVVGTSGRTSNLASFNVGPEMGGYTVRMIIWAAGRFGRKRISVWDNRKKPADISTDPCSRKERSGLQGCSEGTAGPLVPSSLSWDFWRIGYTFSRRNLTHSWRRLAFASFGQLHYSLNKLSVTITSTTDMITLSVTGGTCW